MLGWAISFTIFVQSSSDIITCCYLLFGQNQLVVYFCGNTLYIYLGI